MKTIQHRTIYTICIFVVLFLIQLFFSSCFSKTKKKEEAKTAAVDYKEVKRPLFDADSAYYFVKSQLDFGSRVPGSKAHEACASYLSKRLSSWADTVYIQTFVTKLYNGEQKEGKNIIASFSPEKKKRVLLGAHWDSRMFADQDPDPKNWRKAIPGANDGASGVAVLMEIARLLSTQKPNLGVDIILFDIEDQGTPEFETSYTSENTWCLGSQYWSSNKHIPYYQANYGILLDMVGYHQLRFLMEGVSMEFAADKVRRVWNIAESLGHGSIFLQQRSNPIIDDHLYVNRIAGIPMINIVQQSPEGGFFPYWHTLKDDLEVISKESLKRTGEVVLLSIFTE